ncbi:medium-chain acyl-CoA ligase ACSF2, mitochondrial [Chiloscyllium plagiosum]|uniref:medium-chain acyl-CoA ligase ACSF2, mitochondrial n=1 Tax=Chiloscyllium plagiosum TaxID=36176 RepID=UPI001CB80362|nr:medium-chain acyl-CoA ligase ACSF2, mitochondrial [Chiloscyllium plagiosum]XP_043570513.1 medium-chain acyl-CoA ligase ACSF2, mitochondrial [Chiloscyllium plagiosum]XP_043570514.1 medium-chain acyl-CoA ligase ACSF2, mitochondrial [Chiloscyllium plagiosum]
MLGFALELRSCTGPWNRSWRLFREDFWKCNSCSQTRTLTTYRKLHYPVIIPTKPTLTTSYVHGAVDIPLISKSIGQCLEEIANKSPDKEAMVFLQDGIRKTFGQFKQEVDQMAAGLLAIGLEKGDRLGMWGPNMYEWVLMQFATAQAGIILANINPAYQAREVEFVLRKVGCKALVCPTKFKTQIYYDIIKQCCPELEKATPGDLRSKRLPDLRTIIMIGSKPPGTYSFDEVFNAASSSHQELLLRLQKKISFDDPINIQFTSGTTGNPKGVTLSHHNIVNNARFIGYRMGYDWRNARISSPVPLFHCFGCVGATMNMIIYGCMVVFSSPHFDGRACLEAVQRERCTVIYGTPTMYLDMLNQKVFSTIDLSTLEAAIVAGASCPVEVARKIQSEMNITEFVGAYGMTENSPVTFQGFPMDEITRKLETVGYVAPHIEAKVVHLQSEEVLPLNTAGELWIRGYTVMLGYWDEPEKTRECITPEGWFKTGDIAKLDAYGYCRIVGRCKDIVIRGGENIYPAEVEAFLHTHPKIHEVQVVGVFDYKMGEELCACVKVNDGMECTAEEIKTYCKGQISHFKIPRYMVFVNDFPRTPTGKIQKYKLKEQMEVQLGLGPK